MSTNTDFSILDALHDLARGLDLDTEEGREVFRTRFNREFENCTVRGLRQYARDLGSPRVGQSRAEVERLITSRYTINAQLGHYDTDTITVTLTRAEAQALHNHAEGSLLVGAQNKLRAALGD